MNCDLDVNIPQLKVPPSPGLVYFCSSQKARNDSSLSAGVISQTRLAGGDILDRAVKTTIAMNAFRITISFDGTEVSTSDA